MLRSTRTASTPAVSISRIIPPRPTARIRRVRRWAASSDGSGTEILLLDPWPAAAEFPADMSHLVHHHGRQFHWPRNGADGLHDARFSLARAFRIMDFLRRRIGVLQSAYEVAKMCRLGDDIKRKAAKNQGPRAFVAAGEDDLGYAGVRIFNNSQRFRPRCAGAVDVDQ